MTERAIVLQCSDVDVEFPLASAVSLLDRLRGLPPGAPRVRALTAVSLDVASGSIVGVIGNNGAGKSTLLRVLGDVLPPTRGCVVRLGSLAGVFELGGAGSPHLTGRQYARRFLRLSDVPRHMLPGMLDDICAFAELDAAFDRPVRTYSSGMAARLYFATATAPRHDIYLIDELLAVGDEHFQAKCRARFHALLGSGASGVLVTHDWSSVIRLCRSAHVLDHGRVTFSGPADQAIVRYLDIKPPVANVARFIDRDRRYEARTGDGCSLTFTIQVVQPAPVEMSISIEVLRMGVGWEIVLMADWSAVGDRPGCYEATVRIPALPLPAGEYSLNAFLRRPAQRGEMPQALDIRSWTAGNGLTLTVAGSGGDHLRLPFRFVRPASHAS